MHKAKQHLEDFRAFYRLYYGREDDVVHANRIRNINFSLAPSGRQHDACSCGVYVFINAMRVMGLWSTEQIANLTASQRAVNALRFRIAEAVYTVMFSMFESLVDHPFPSYKIL